MVIGNACKKFERLHVQLLNANGFLGLIDCIV